MLITHKQYDPAKTEIYQTKYIQITSKKPMHFQVDGEYLGATDSSRATIIPEIISVVVPA